MIEVVANMHMHTPYSDGEKYHRDIAADAAKAGVDVVVVTDHNVFVRGVDGYVGGVLVLAGEEVHDVLRSPQASHCLVIGACEGMSPHAERPQKLVNAVNQRRGLTFFAHPFEKASPISSDLDAIPWADWDVRGNTGLEVWNYMTELKARIPNCFLGAFSVFFPSCVIFGPFKQTLRRWDELLAEGKRVVIVGNADAHGFVYKFGPLRREVLAYDYLFRCVNTHVLLDRPLTRNADADQRLLYDALRNGRCFVGYDLPKSTRGFGFVARDGSQTATMGDEIRQQAAIRFEVKTPGLAQIRLLRDGKVVAQKIGRTLELLTSERGVYRVEARRWFRLAWRGWIFSNPIYVR